MADEPGTKVVVTPGTTLPPVAVTVIGTMKDAIPADGTIATIASAAAPNLLVRTVQPFTAIAIRFGNNFAFGLSGALTVVWGTGFIPFTNVVDGFKKAVIMTLIVVVPVLLKDIGTVFSGLEKTHPLATGSV